jgi:hypothetical protein
MNRRDLIFFGLAAAAIGSVLLLNRKTVAPIIGRIGSTVSIGSDPAAIADAIQEAMPERTAAVATAAAATLPTTAIQIGGRIMVPGPNPRFYIPWNP